MVAMGQRVIILPYGGSLGEQDSIRREAIFAILTNLPQWEPKRFREGLRGYQPQGATGAKAKWVNKTQNQGAVGPFWPEKSVHVAY